MMEVSVARAALAVAAALAVVACAVPQSRRGAPPTLADYSANTSRLATEFGAAFKAKDAKTLDALVSDQVVLTPADRPAGPAFESPSRLRVERFTTGTGAVTGEAARAALSERRERFQGVVRNELHVIGIEGSGERRTVRVHSFFAGPGSDTSRRQDESWWRWELVSVPPTEVAAPAEAEPKPATPPAWRIVSMVEERRIVTVAPQALFEKMYPPEGGEAWLSDSDRDADFESTIIPGVHDSGGISVRNDCVNSGPCLFAGGGVGIGVLSRGRSSDEGEFQNRASLLGLAANMGEAKEILVSDFDNDGIPDIFMTFDRTPCRFFKGKRLLEEAREGSPGSEHLAFDDATDASGLGALQGPYRGAVAFDADADGRLDLYVVQFGDTSLGGPSEKGDNGLPNHFFRNVTEPGGPVRFEDQTAQSGTGNTGWGFGAAAADYDGDGRIDLYVVNNFGVNALYRNVTPPHGAVRFVEVGAKTGTDARISATGATWGDYDGDGDLDLFVTAAALDEKWILLDPSFPAGSSVRKTLAGRLGGCVLFRNDVARSGRFTQVAESAGVGDGGWGWGAGWADIDGDGRLDLVVGNGMLIGERGENREVDFWTALGGGWQEFSQGHWNISLSPDGVTGPQSERLFLNLGDGTFVDVAYAAGFVTMADVRGLIATDINDDGAPDIAEGVFLGSPEFYENMNLGGPTRVRVALFGATSNADGVGAIVRLTAGSITQTRQVAAGESYLSDPGRILSFSLVGGMQVDHLEVLWPSGLKSSEDLPPTRRGLIVVTEPAAESDKP